MLIVLDDVLDEEHLAAVVDFFSRSDEARETKWEKGGLDKLRGNNSPMALLLTCASQFFDLSDMIGSEYWANYGTRTDWHVDKDEKLYKTSGDVNCPICSIVYYADIDVSGGNFVTETLSVRPVTNRMIVFSPGLVHGVEYFTGKRLSVAINPCAHKPTTYL